jgi:hypothetical protein
VRKLLVAVLVLGLALPVFAKQVGFDGVVGDTYKILFLGSIISDNDIFICGMPFEPVIEVLNEPKAYTNEFLKLRITNIPWNIDAYLYLIRNDGGKDVVIYGGAKVWNGAVFAVPAPSTGWLVGTYPIKVIVTTHRLWEVKDNRLVPTTYSYYCCPGIEVEQILITIRTPPCPPPPSCCSPQPPCCQINVCWQCLIPPVVIGAILLNLLICDP